MPDGEGKFGSDEFGLGGDDTSADDAIIVVGEELDETIF